MALFSKPPAKKPEAPKPNAKPAPAGAGDAHARFGA